MPQYTYQRVYDDLRSRIGPDKEFPPGAALPSRRQLRERYDVSDVVIDRAMWMLRQEGLTETLQGVGVYVVEELPDTFHAD